MKYTGIVKIFIETDTREEHDSLFKKLKELCNSTGKLGYEKMWIKDSDMVEEKQEVIC